MKKILGALVLGLAVYELYALADHESGDTISEVVWTESRKRSILPFAVGVLCGHFFWQREQNRPPKAS